MRFADRWSGCRIARHPRRPKKMVGGVAGPHDDDAAEVLYASLTDSVRRLVDATIRSQADFDGVASAKAKIDAAADELSSSVIPGSFGGVQLDASGNPPRAWGQRGHRTAQRVGAAARRTPGIRRQGLGRGDAGGAAYEGPPGHVHGGICALLLDHVLGGATAHKPGRPAVTGTLTLRYESGDTAGTCSGRGARRPDRGCEDLRGRAPVDGRRDHSARGSGLHSSADSVTPPLSGSGCCLPHGHRSQWVLATKEADDCARHPVR